jgi:hypothetical protein
MSSYVITLNEEFAPAKSLLEVLKSLSYVTIIPQKCKKERPYNPEFVAEILRSDKSKGVKIKREDLWK